MTILNERLIIVKGERCPFSLKCERPCIAKLNLENEFSCGLFKEYVK
ncbi:hypothetical protein [Lutibacter sp.]|nr:hypothetical protein [Lutibacter sp.]